MFPIENNLALWFSVRKIVNLLKYTSLDPKLYCSKKFDGAGSMSGKTKEF